MGIFSPFIIVAFFCLVMSCQSTYLNQICKDGDIVIFGTNLDEKRLKSSIENSFDAQRNDLSRYMESIALMVLKLADLEGHISHSSRKYQELKLIHDDYRNKAARIPELWNKNEQLLRWLINISDFKLTIPLLSQPSRLGDFGDLNELYRSVSIESSFESSTHSSNFSASSSVPPSYESLNQILIHLSRDWTDRGASIRKVLYTDGIVRQLQKYFPVSNTSQPSRVLVPGAGLGRLAVELAAHGYLVEANECSAVMVCVMSSIINKLLVSNKIVDSKRYNTVTVYPHLFGPLIDLYDIESRLVAETLPSTDSAPLIVWFQEQPLLNIKRHISINLNDFTKTYSKEEYRRYFEVVVTCFFIDTASSILEYLIIIRHVLKENGVWINLGPLHYHRPSSFYYTYKQLKQIITKVVNFEVLHEEFVSCMYTAEDDVSMKPEWYRVPLLVLRKKKVDCNNGVLCNDKLLKETEGVFDTANGFNDINFILKR